MGEAFEARFTGVLAGPPEQVWAAITTGTGGWLWPIAYEPFVGGHADGAMAHAVVTDWDPPRRFANHATRDDWFNTLTWDLTPTDDGTLLHFTHRGVHEGDYDTEQSACLAHTDFYYHSLGEYVAHFPGRTATYTAADAPDGGPSFTTVLTALGADTAQVGDPVHLHTPDGPVEGTVDYRTPSFLGVRTADSLVRVYGRDTWGWPVGVAVHSFTQDPTTTAATWERFLGELA